MSDIKCDIHEDYYNDCEKYDDCDKKYHCCYYCDRCEWKVRKAYWAGYRAGFHDGLYCHYDKVKFDEK